MIKIAISGNIASGKSEVEKLLLKKGYKILDTDKVCHNLLSSDKNIIEQIISVFGTSILDDKNQISRKQLGKTVFSDSSKRALLENILHPEIKNRVKTFFLENQAEKFVFVSVPLLFETKTEGDFDKIIFISAQTDVRLKRLTARNALTKDEAMQRIESQQKEQEKTAKSDFVIENNSSLEELEEKLNRVLEVL